METENTLDQHVGLFVPALDFEPPPIQDDFDDDKLDFSGSTNTEWADFSSYVHPISTVTEGNAWGRFTPPPLSPQECDTLSCSPSQLVLAVDKETHSNVNAIPSQINGTAEYSAQLINAIHADSVSEDNPGNNEEPVFGLFYKDDSTNEINFKNDSYFANFTSFDNIYFTNDVSSNIELNEDRSFGSNDLANLKTSQKSAIQKEVVLEDESQSYFDSECVKKSTTNVQSTPTLEGISDNVGISNEDIFSGVYSSSNQDEDSVDNFEGFKVVESDHKNVVDSAASKKVLTETVLDEIEKSKIDNIMQNADLFVNDKRNSDAVEKNNDHIISEYTEDKKNLKTPIFDEFQSLSTLDKVSTGSKEEYAATADGCSSHLKSVKKGEFLSSNKFDNDNTLDELVVENVFFEKDNQKLNKKESKNVERACAGSVISIPERAEEFKFTDNLDQNFDFFNNFDKSESANAEIEVCLMNKNIPINSSKFVFEANDKDIGTFHTDNDNSNGPIKILENTVELSEAQDFKETNTDFSTLHGLGDNKCHNVSDNENILLELDNPTESKNELEFETKSTSFEFFISDEDTLVEDVDENKFDGLEYEEASVTVPTKFEIQDESQNHLDLDDFNFEENNLESSEPTWDEKKLSENISNAEVEFKETVCDTHGPDTNSSFSEFQEVQQTEFDDFTMANANVEFTTFLSSVEGKCVFSEVQEDKQMDEQRNNDFGDFKFEDNKILDECNSFESNQKVNTLLNFETKEFGHFGDINFESQIGDFQTFETSGTVSREDRFSNFKFEEAESYEFNSDFAKFESSGNENAINFGDVSKENEVDTSTNDFVTFSSVTNQIIKVITPKYISVMDTCFPYLNYSEEHQKRIYELTAYINNTCLPDMNITFWEEMTTKLYDEEQWLKVFFTSDTFKSQLSSFPIDYDALLKSSHSSLANLPALSPATSVTSIDIEMQLGMLVPEPAFPSKTLLAQSKNKILAEKTPASLIQRKELASESISETASLDLDFFAAGAYPSQGSPMSTSVNLFDIDLSSVNTNTKENMNENTTESAVSFKKTGDNDEDSVFKSVSCHNYSLKTQGSISSLKSINSEESQNSKDDDFSDFVQLNNTTVTGSSKHDVNNINANDRCDIFSLNSDQNATITGDSDFKEFESMTQKPSTFKSVNSVLNTGEPKKCTSHSNLVKSLQTFGQYNGEVDDKEPSGCSSVASLSKNSDVLDTSFGDFAAFTNAAEYSTIIPQSSEWFSNFDDTKHNTDTEQLKTPNLKQPTSKDLFSNIKPSAQVGGIFQPITQQQKIAKVDLTDKYSVFRAISMDMDAPISSSTDPPGELKESSNSLNITVRECKMINDNDGVVAAPNNIIAPTISNTGWSTNEIDDSVVNTETTDLGFGGQHLIIDDSSFGFNEKAESELLKISKTEKSQYTPSTFGDFGDFNTVNEVEYMSSEFADFTSFTRATNNDLTAPQIEFTKDFTKNTSTSLKTPEVTTGNNIRHQREESDTQVARVQCSDIDSSAGFADWSSVANEELRPNWSNDHVSDNLKLSSIKSTSESLATSQCSRAPNIPSGSSDFAVFTRSCFPSNTDNFTLITSIASSQTQHKPPGVEKILTSGTIRMSSCDDVTKDILFSNSSKLSGGAQVQSSVGTFAPLVQSFEVPADDQLSSRDFGDFTDANQMHHPINSNRFSETNQFEGTATRFPGFGSQINRGTSNFSSNLSKISQPDSSNIYHATHKLKDTTNQQKSSSLEGFGDFTTFPSTDGQTELYATSVGQQDIASTVFGEFSEFASFNNLERPSMLNHSSTSQSSCSSTSDFGKFSSVASVHQGLNNFPDSRQPQFSFNQRPEERLENVNLFNVNPTFRSSPSMTGSQQNYSTGNSTYNNHSFANIPNGLAMQNNTSFRFQNDHTPNATNPNFHRASINSGFHLAQQQQQQQQQLQNKQKYISSHGKDPFADFNIQSNASQLRLKSSQPLNKVKKSLNEMKKK